MIKGHYYMYYAELVITLHVVNRPVLVQYWPQSVP